MTVGGNTIAAEGLGAFFGSPSEKELIASTKMAKRVLRNPGTTSEIGGNVRTAFASKGPKKALSTLLDVINVYHCGKGFHPENLFEFFSFQGCTLAFQ